MYCRITFAELQGYVTVDNLFKEDDLKQIDDDIDHIVDELANFLFKQGKITGRDVIIMKSKNCNNIYLLFPFNLQVK